jgi:hypothetical protein
LTLRRHAQARAVAGPACSGGQNCMFTNPVVFPSSEPRPQWIKGSLLTTE